MTDSEYLKLLNNSPSFQALSEIDKEAIRKATGEERESFIKTFMDEAEIVARAYTKLADETEKVVTDLKHNGQKNKKEKLVKEEVSQHANEMDTAENLLKNL